MMVSTRLAVPNSVLLVLDPLTGEIPDTMGGSAVASTPTCVAVGTWPEPDGETSIVFSDEAMGREASRDLRRVFDGVISTPSLEVHLCTVALDSLAKVSVSTSRVRVEVWTNRVSAPDRVLIIVGTGGAASAPHGRGPIAPPQ